MATFDHSDIRGLGRCLKIEETNGQLSILPFGKAEGVWEQSQKLLPGWPGFTRTMLNNKELESYKACVEEKEQIFEMLINEYNTEIHYRCTGLGFVLKGFTFRATR